MRNKQRQPLEFFESLWFTVPALAFVVVLLMARAGAL